MMMERMSMKRALAAACGGLAWWLLASFAPAQIVNRGMAGETGVTAYFAPSNVIAGQQTQYTILVTNGVPDRPVDRNLSIPGLPAVFLRQTTRIEQTLSGPQRLTSYLYMVRANRPGRFTAPPRELTIGGRTFEVPACDLVVRTPEELQIAPEDLERGAFAFVYPGKDTCYAGEVVPLELTLYVDSRFSVSDWGYPELERENFIIKRFERRYPVDVLVGGKRYFAVCYSSFVSPLTAGSYQLGPVEFDCQVREIIRSPATQPGVRTANRYAPSRRMTVLGPAAPLEVRALPGGEASGVPVGTFTVEASADPTTLTVGDPVELVVEVRGRGNLDGILMPELPEEVADQWRLFQSTSEVRKTNSSSLEGVVVLRRLMAPATPVTEIPPLGFRFFDPESGAYRDLETEAIPLTVTENEEDAEIAVYDGDRDALKPVETTNDILTLVTDAPAPPVEGRSWTAGAAFQWLRALPVLGIAGLLAYGFYRRWGSRWMAPRRAPEAGFRELSRQLRSRPLSERDFYNGFAAACAAWRRERGRRLPEPVDAALASIRERREVLNYAGGAGSALIDRSRRAYLLQSLGHLS